MSAAILGYPDIRMPDKRANHRDAHVMCLGQGIKLMISEGVIKNV